MLSLLPAGLEDMALPSPALAAGMAGGFVGDMAGARTAVAETLTIMVADGGPSPWGAFWAVRDRVTVGICSFKGPPDGSGTVEIAYYTFPDFEGEGVGRGMATALTDLAFGAGALSVIAHTLPKEGASPAILRRVGFVHEGEVEDPEEGTVWRWRWGPAPSL